MNLNNHRIHAPSTSICSLHLASIYLCRLPCPALCAPCHRLLGQEVRNLQIQSQPRAQAAKTSLCITLLARVFISWTGSAEETTRQTPWATGMTCVLCHQRAPQRLTAHVIDRCLFCSWHWQEESYSKHTSTDNSQVATLFPLRLIQASCQIKTWSTTFCQHAYPITTWEKQQVAYYLLIQAGIERILLNWKNWNFLLLILVPVLSNPGA